MGHSDLRYVIIHGHFYQPPRESPWTGLISPESGAAPFVNWNERILSECYAANGHAHTMEDHVVHIRNNYEILNFDFGPTLMSWLERHGKAGLASAYAVGFERASAERYDLVVEMDSDLSHLPQELPRLLEAVQDHDVVIGSRYVPGGSVTDWSRGRVALSKAGNRYARFCLGFPVHDATSGFRVYRREALEAIVATPLRSDGYAFQVELAYRAWNLGLSVAEVPITFREREHGRSKISRRIVAEALCLITIWGLRARFRPRPGT